MYDCRRVRAAATTDGQVCTTADACVLPQLRLVGAYDCRRVCAAVTAVSRVRMTADVFVLLHY